MSITASNNPFPHDPAYNWNTKLDKNGYQGTANDLFQRINDIEYPNEILIKGNVVKTSNMITIAAESFTCRINQNILTNSNIYTTTIDEAEDGYHRIDILVFTKFGNIVKIKGVEDIESAQEPPTPNETLKISFISVFGNVIGNPELPIEDGFISKASKGFIRIFQTGNLDFINVDDKSYLKFEEGVLSLKSLNITNTQDVYHGRDFILKNGSSGNLTIYHNQGTGNFKFNIPGSQNLILKPEESFHFVMRAINYGNNGGLLDYVGVVLDLSDKADLVGGVVPWWQLPSYVDDILEGYLFSNVFYVESSHTTVIPAEAGKIYVDITSGQKNKQYRYSGSTYIQITNGLIASTDDVPEGATNKYSTLALVLSYVLTGISFSTGTPIVSTDTILIAFGKLQKQITDLISSVSGKQVLDTQIEISTNSNVLNAWHGQTILFTSSCTITVPSTLNNSLMFPFRTLSGVTVLGRE